MAQESIKLFNEHRIRTQWDAEEEDWYFSVVDVCNVLSESNSIDPSAYWRKLKQRLKKEGCEIVTNCHGLRLTASDGKKYTTDCLNTKNRGCRGIGAGGKEVKCYKKRNYPIA